MPGKNRQQAKERNAVYAVFSASLNTDGRG